MWILNVSNHLQDEPLQVRIMDYDTYSANDAIGKVCEGQPELMDKMDLFLGLYRPQPSATASARITTNTWNRRVNIVFS